MIHQKLGGKIIGAATDVLNELKPRIRRKALRACNDY